MATIIPNANLLLGGRASSLVDLAPTNVLDILAVAIIGLGSLAYIFPKQTWNKPDPYDFIWFEKPQSQDGADGGAQVSRNIAQRLDELAKDVVIFWGSQSGTAEGFATRLSRELYQRYRLKAMAADLSDFDPETIENIPRAKLAIFILSTYGEGDPSDNAGSFWDWATRLKGSTLSSLRYAAFGLGNSDYRHYNRVVTVIDEVLQQNQAERLLHVGKADDATGTTGEDFTRWKEDLFSCLRKTLKLEEHEASFEPALSATFDNSLDLIDLHTGEPVGPAASTKGRADSPIKPIQVKSYRELFDLGSRNCLHMEFDLSAHPEIAYKTGDHMAIFPVNPDQEIKCLIWALGIANKEHEPLCIKSLDPAVKVTIPSPTTIHALLKYYIDICAPVPRDIVRSLAEFAPSEKARDFLQQVTDSADAFNHFLDKNYITLAKVMNLAVGGDETTWSQLPLEFILESLPRARVRYYSISSSSVLSPRTPAITAVVSNKTLGGENATIIPGLTTNYLLGISQSMRDISSSPSHPEGLTYDLEGPSGCLHGPKLFANVRRSTFKLPGQASTPLIMAAAGTGIAPFRAFIAERARLDAMGRDVGEMILFFGCRNPCEDFIYRDELEAAANTLKGKLKIVTAFSRAQDQKKAYVQDKMSEFSHEVVRMIEADASLYVCGKTTMAREIESTVGSVYGKIHAWEESQAQDWVTKMRRTGKWHEDVWG